MVRAGSRLNILREQKRSIKDTRTHLWWAVSAARHLLLCSAVAALACGVSVSQAQAANKQAAAPSAQFDPSKAEIQTLHVQGNVYLLSGAGGNVTVQIGEEGVLVVDTGLQPMADKLLAAIRKLADGKIIRFVVNTHVHPDHVGGNEKIRMGGATIMGGNVVNDDPRGQQGATVIAHGNVLARMADTSGESASPAALWPTETFDEDSYDLFFNDEAVQLIHQPAAHTDGDVMVYFRKSDVLSTGDLFVTTTYPIIDLQRGGSINGIVAGLNKIIDITVPRDKQEGGTFVIPGHGRVCDEADLVDYRDMVTIIRDRIQEMVDAGMTLQQVQAAKPTSDYDGRYGGSTGFWTTEKFVEAAYRSLHDAKKANAG